MSKELRKISDWKKDCLIPYQGSGDRPQEDPMPGKRKKERKKERATAQ
jgi:hypothetical protein